MNLTAYLRAAILAGASIMGAGVCRADDVVKPAWKLGGAIRFNYVHKSWQDEYPRGFVGLDTARLNLDYDDGRLLGAAEYRYNRFPQGQGGYWQHFLHHGWAGVRFADRGTLHIGLDKVPFGILPFASNNFYQSIAFYAGFEDKYDLGVAYASRPGPVEWQLGFYPRDGGSYGGGANTARASNRYSYNIVADDDAHGFGTGQRDRERNTLVARLTWHPGPAGQHELGASGLTGAIRNGAGIDTRRNAVALHYAGTFGPVKAMLQTSRYHYGTRHDATQTYDGLDANSFVMLGAFGFPYPLATQGSIHIANLAYDIGGKLGPLGGFKLYNDYSILRKHVGSYRASVQNVTGMTFSSGKWVFYADFMLGKHHPYLSPDAGGLAATAAQHDGFTRRINLQAGYYF
ncbi:outer membrane beta barrel protein [Pseudoduganella plicata]|nr:outer membrane beta barrel protein [Pseudoduganella plicata]